MKTDPVFPSLLSEAQAECSSGLGGIVTAPKWYCDIESRSIGWGLFKGLWNNAVPSNNGSFVSSAKSQKLSELELIDIFFKNKEWKTHSVMHQLYQKICSVSLAVNAQINNLKNTVCFRHKYYIHLAKEIIIISAGCETVLYPTKRDYTDVKNISVLHC